MSPIEVECSDWQVPVGATPAQWRRATQVNRPIKSHGAYIAAVRHKWPETEKIDDRLIAAVWREPAIPPREWCEGGRGQQWLAYWQAAVPRPEKIGSSYNQQPEIVARAWALGIATSRMEKCRAAIPALPAHWTGQRERIRALLLLSTRGIETPGELRTADLRRLCRLSGATLRAITWVPTTHKRRVDWVALARLVKDVRENVRLAGGQEILQSLRIPAQQWGGPELRQLAVEAAAKALARQAWEARQAKEFAIWQAMVAAEAANKTKQQRSEERQERQLEQRMAMRCHGAFIGWREWVLSNGGDMLASPFRKVLWPAASFSADAPLPQGSVRDEVGIHAYWTPQSCTSTRYAHYVWGRVLGHGVVIHGREGWRAEHVVIDRLYVSPRLKEDTLKALKARYGVPVSRRDQERCYAH